MGQRNNLLDTKQWLNPDFSKNLLRCAKQIDELCVDRCGDLDSLERIVPTGFRLPSEAGQVRLKPASDESPWYWAAKTPQSPRRGRHNSDLSDKHFLSNVAINNLDHIFAEFCAGQTYFNNPSVLIAATKSLLRDPDIAETIMIEKINCFSV